MFEGVDNFFFFLVFSLCSQRRRRPGDDERLYGGAATAEQTRAKLGMYESRSRAMPQLRHQLLEVCTEKKLQLERQYLSEQARPVQHTRFARSVTRSLDI